MIFLASIIIVMIVAVLGKFISKDGASKTQTGIVKTTVPVVKNTDTKVIEEVPVNEMKVVPSLIGSTQEIAKQDVVNNGFLLGNVSNNYSDSIANGLVISQSPEVNTSYEKGGKIDLVISQGKKAVEPAVPIVKVERDKKKGKTIDQKKQKNNHSKN